MTELLQLYNPPMYTQEVSRLHSTLFLDRDGTISEEVGYITHVDQLRLLPGSAKAIRTLRAHGMKAVVVTNQAGVARGYFSEELIAIVHRKLHLLLEVETAYLDGIYYCPHHPDFGSEKYRKKCTCRKPEIGMFLKAAKDLAINPLSSYMVGDKKTDIEFAHKAEIKGILVLTGFGRSELTQFGKEDKPPAYVAKDLPEAATWILQDRVNQER